MIKQWLKERLPFNFDALRAFGSEPVPDHLRYWWWALGGTPAYLFALQIVTGMLLAFYYVPSTDGAYESVQKITNDISYGWYLRSLHRWSANLMILAVILHMMRVFFTGAYRKPREANWIVGTLLLTLTLLLGFSGYSLVYEQLSYWGLTVASNITESVPLLGPVLADFIRGGSSIGQATLSRMFVIHAALLPVAVIALLGIHFALLHSLGISRLHFKDTDEKKTFPFVPDHLFNEIILALSLMLILTFLAIVFPVGLEEKANPLVTPPHIKPEWYFYFTFRILKLTSLNFAVFSIGIGFALVMLWPFIDARIRKNKPDSELSMVFGIVGVLVLTGLTVWEALALFLAH